MKQIEKCKEDPEWVQEVVDGRLVIHNKKLEEWIPQEQPIELYGILWSREEQDILSSEKLKLLFNMYPIVDSRPQIFYGKNKNQYVLYKDPRLPVIVPHRSEPVLKQVVQRCEYTRGR